MRLSHVLAFAAAAVSVSAFAEPSIPTTHSANTVLVQATPQAAYRLTPDGRATWSAPSSSTMAVR